MSATRSSTTQNLYRIVSFERAVQLLKSSELYFSHPSTWEDPYDQGVKHKRSPDIFAQCWCRKAVSDAMWRIYSPNTLGVRIGTTLERLKTELTAARDAHQIQFKVQNIRYFYEEELLLKLEILEKKRKEKPSFGSTVAPLFLKRNAFDHERETRVVLYQSPTAEGATRNGIAIPVNPHKLIRSIWIDPRASSEYVDAYTHYLKNVLEFKGTVKKSSLYAATDPQGE